MPRAGVPLPRPSDMELRARIIEGLQSGLSFGVAAENAGIAERTIFAWMKQGRDDVAEGRETTPHAQFLQHIARAHEQATGVLESRIYEVAKDGKRPDITLAVLRVRRPDPWRDVLRVEGDDSAPGDTAKTDAEIRAELARLRRITGSTLRDRPRARTRAGASSTGKPAKSRGVQ